jgi:hypothetical protein
MEMTITEKRSVVIVENEREFSATLFKPINGRTADGYVRKRGKRFCDVFIAGKICRINRFGVWCEQGSDGRWTFANLSQFGYAALCDAADALAVSTSWERKEKEYTFSRY